MIDGVKKKLAEIKGSLPPGVEVVSGYDRAGLISESINTLKRSLIEEAVIVSLVIIVFLFHFRSALIPILTLPIALAISFIPMYYLNVSSNIMSLGGMALAIGVLVDAAIVMVENGHRHLSERPAQASERERVRILVDAAKQVGPALFFSLLIIVVSFLPVFLLEAQEGRMFRPLAWPHGHFHSREAAVRIGESGLKSYAGALFASVATLHQIPKDDVIAQLSIPPRNVSLNVQAGQSIHAALV